MADSAGSSENAEKDVQRQKESAENGLVADGDVSVLYWVNYSIVWWHFIYK